MQVNVRPESNTSVLIVDAGPTGLMMACQLTRFGIRTSSLRKTAGQLQSRALQFRPGQSEVFDQMGIAASGG